MPTTHHTRALRNLLILDAGTCAVMGALLILGAGLLASLTMIPATLLFYAGVVLFPIAAFMVFAALQAINSEKAVWLIIAGNALWVAASLGLIFSGWIRPNTLGYAFIVLQAAAVALLTILEHKAWRRMTQGVEVLP